MRALRDQSGLVVRRALSLLAKEGQLLGCAELQQAYASAQSERVRRQLIRAARLMGKWDALVFLLPLLSTSDALEMKLAGQKRTSTGLMRPPHGGYSNLTPPKD